MTRHCTSPTGSDRRRTRGFQMGLDFAALAHRGTVWTPADRRRRPVRRAALSDPERSRRAGLRDGGGRWPATAAPWHADQRLVEGRLRLLSPVSPWSLNSSFSNDQKVTDAPARLRWTSPKPTPPLWVGRRRACGASSPAGSLVVPVHITDALPAGVALIPKGRWPKARQDGANVNALTLARPSDMGTSTTVHGLEVTVTPADEPARG